MDDTKLSNGHRVGGFNGMVKTVLNAIETVKPDQLFIVWDSASHMNWRLRLFPNYKAHRKPKTQEEIEMREHVSRQVDWCHKFFSFLPVHQLRYEGLEGDDLGYWIVRRMWPHMLSMITMPHHYTPHYTVATIDRDWLQLVRWDCDVYLPDLDFTVDLENFQEATAECISELKHSSGVSLGDFIKYKQLVGDSSDGVPGAFGVGPKTALKLLDQGLSLEECADEDSKVLFSFDQVQLNRILFDLSCYPYTPHLDRILLDQCRPGNNVKNAYRFAYNNRLVSVLADWERLESLFESVK